MLGESGVSRPGNAVGVFGLLHKVELAQLMSHARPADRGSWFNFWVKTEGKPSCVLYLEAKG